MKCNRGINNNLKGIFCNLVFKNNKYKKGIIIILGLVFINCCDYEKITNPTKEANKEGNELIKNNGDGIELVGVKSINEGGNEKNEDQASETTENKGMFSDPIDDSFLKEERCSYC